MCGVFVCGQSDNENNEQLLVNRNEFYGSLSGTAVARARLRLQRLHDANSWKESRVFHGRNYRRSR